MHDHRFHRLYNKEEEFLAEFGFGLIVSAALKAFEPGEWEPNHDANDAIRKQHKYFMSAGELSGVVFDCAAVYLSEGKVSKVQISLASPKKTVTVTVTRVGEGFEAIRAEHENPAK